MRLAAAVLAVLLFAPAVRAEDRALLIGVGSFQDSQINPLPGIDLDVNMVRGVAEKLGFKPSQIRTLSDAQGTFAGIRAAIDEWLVAGAGPNDRVLLYFSGHGSQIPDLDREEEDGQDEVLITYDTTLAGGTLANVVTDDLLGQWLAKIQAGTTYVLVDACHSGSVTKGVRTPAAAVVKYYDYRRLGGSRAIAAPKDESFTDRQVTRGGGRFVQLSAAADNEQSLASTQGSFFTIGLTKAVDGAFASQKLTIREVQKIAAEEIVKLADASRVHHPTIGGDPTLADANVFARAAADDGGNAGTMWQLFEELADLATDKLTISNVRATYTLRDRMQIELTVNRPGYVNIVSISQVTDEVTVLFPNQMAPENQIAGPNVPVPAPGARYQLMFAKPDGVAEERNLLVAVFTDQPLSFYQLGSGQQMFRALTGQGARAAKGAVATATYAAGKAVYVLR